MGQEDAMSDEAAAKEGRFLNVEIRLGLGPGYQLSLNLDEPQDVERKIVDIVEIAQQPLRAEIHQLKKENELLKKRTLSSDEIQHLAKTLRTHPSETRFDGRPTNDDVLVTKLEGMLKS
jgi:hypothetical protein